MEMELVTLSISEAVGSIGEQLSTATGEGELSREFLAANLRRAASLFCPTTPRALVSAVDDALSPMCTDADLRTKCRDILQDLIAIGDLMEYDEVASVTDDRPLDRRLVYAAPPYFVALTDARFLILGIAPDGIDQVPEEVQLLTKKHIRTLSTADFPNARQLLLNYGLHEVPYEAWARSPKVESAEAVCSRMNKVLDASGPCGRIEELRILDGSIVSPWYKDRWVSPRGQSGRFVGTRPRKFGADLWCYIQLEDGEAQSLVDLPLGRSLERGCDQAWRLQCALDAELGHPQTYMLTELDRNRGRIDIHTPSPNWLQRRWDCIGSRAGDSVFSYIFDLHEAASEAALLEERLWMIPE
jgi:hypothetical protein